MAYQVIARKWRPQVFEELAGQEAIARTLQNAIADGRLHHAYIFAGPRGVGKTTTARILAKALNCVTGPTIQPCNQCVPCQEISRGSSIDVLEIDAASHTGVDNVREVIINNIAIGPARDRYRVFIIDEFHQLSTAAFNALLKTLEEPPAHVLFIMATTELHKVPMTILSRCQVFEFRLIAENKILARLRQIADAEGVKISDSALRRIARAGEGSMRDAQSIFDQVISFCRQTEEIKDEDVAAALGTVGAEMLASFADAIADQDGRRLIRLLDELINRGHDLRNFCRELMTHFRNLLLMKTVGSDRDLLPLDQTELALLAKQADRFSEEEIIRAFHHLTEVEQNIRFSPEPRFQLEVGLVKLAHIERLRPVVELVQRVEEIERRLQNPSSYSAAAPVASSKVAASEMRDDPASRIPHPVAAASDQQPMATGGQIEQIKTELSARGKMVLVATLDRAKTLDIIGDTLRIIFPAGSAGYKETLLDKATAQLIESVAETVTGRKIRLNVSVEEAKRTAASERRGRTGKQSATIESDPIVKAFVKTFKGEIVDVVPKEEEG